jgi:hypothetical protein
LTRGYQSNRLFPGRLSRPAGSGTALIGDIPSARILVTLLHSLMHRKQKLGVAALCLGGGNAVAMLIERL